MVELRMTEREIVFRVLYAGDDGATKFATIRSLHESLSGGSINVLHAGGDRVVMFRHRPRVVEPLFGLDVSVETLTIPGRLRCPANAELLMSVADAVIYLDDRSHREDEDVVSERFEEFLGRLGSTRGGRDMPFWVQCYSDGPPQRLRLFEREGAWAPRVEVLDSDARPRVVFERVQDAMLTEAREWERDLRRRGLDDHVKIRDRIYEKVALLPAAPPEDGVSPAEIRLVRSLAEPEAWGPRRSVLLAAFLVLGVAAAAFVLSLLV